jgi:hypothetical protein
VILASRPEAVIAELRGNAGLDTDPADNVYKRYRPCGSGTRRSIGPELTNGPFL